MNTKFLLIFVFVVSLQIAYAQVGIGTTDPKSNLDITASNTSNPSNTDGLLIPRIDNFPSSNPAADQDGMMVFATGNGAPSKGFYFWDNDTTSWISVRGSDSDFYEIGTTTPPDAIIDDIYTLGKLKIGQNSPANASLSVHDWNSSNFSAVNISRSLNTPSTSGQFNGFYTSLDAQTSDNYFGVQSILSGNIQSQSANYYALASGSLDGFTNLFSGSFYSASGTGRLYGVNVGFMSTVTNTGNKYGFNVDIPSSLPGTHYGLYSNVQNSSGYAAYLIGRISLGHTTANRYIMPSADGSTGQVMTTDGLGNISFETPVSGAERINDLLDAKSDNDGSEDGSSIFLGVNAGANDDSTNNWNVAIGFNALEDNISGVANSAFGWRSLAENTANNNTAFGYLSAASNTTGTLNTAIGRSALLSNSTGSYNTALGSYALDLNSTGSSNVAIGFGAFFNNSTGSNNTIIGFEAGEVAYGSGNVFIGHQAARSENAVDNTLFIENTDADENNALIYGQFGVDNTTTGHVLRTNGEFQIGNPSTTGYAFPTIDGLAGQVLTSDGSGHVTFEDVTTSDNDWVEVGSDIERQSGDVYIGDSATTNNALYTSGSIIDWDDANYTIDLNGFNKLSRLELDGGSNASPGLAIGDNNTGFYSNSVGTLNHTGNGISTFNIFSDGEINFRGFDSNYDFASSNVYYNAGISMGTGNPSIPLVYGYIDNDANEIISEFEILSNNINFSHSALRAFSDIGDNEVRLAYNSSATNRYAVYAISPNDFAGYFRGEVQFGTSTSNRYNMPAADGSAGQIMTTDGAGNLSFQNPIINTDDQQIDNFGLSGTILGISLEDDGAPIATVDLSSIITDDQQIDNFSFNSSTNVLTLEMENDGQAAQTVNLSSLNPTKSLARITMSTNQSFTTNTWQKIDFNTVDFDLKSEFNTTTDEFVISSTGYYRINACWRSVLTSTSIDAFGIAIVVNGTIERAVNFNNSGNGFIFRSVNSVLDLNAGDTIEIHILPTVPIDVLSTDIVTSLEIEQL